VVLNTSFNENEPIVCTPKEALDCFLRTKMDVLVLGNFYITYSVLSVRPEALRIKQVELSHRHEYKVTVWGL